MAPKFQKVRGTDPTLDRVQDNIAAAFVDYGNQVANGTSTVFNVSTTGGTNSGDVTLAPVGSSPNANAATLTGQVLNLEPASATQPGVVTTGTQTIAGTKTLTSLLSSTVVSGANAIKLLDGARLNLSTTDPSTYLYRQAANTVGAAGSFRAGLAIITDATGNTAFTATAGGATLAGDLIAVNGAFSAAITVGTSIQAGAYIYTTAPAGTIAFSMLNGAKMCFGTGSTLVRSSDGTTVTDDFPLTVTGILNSSVASGLNAVKLLDGARLNFSTADGFCYLARGAANYIQTGGGIVAGILGVGIGLGNTASAPLHVIGSGGSGGFTPVGDETIVCQRNAGAGANAVLTVLADNTGIAAIRLGKTSLSFQCQISYDNSTDTVGFRIANVADKVTFTSIGTIKSTVASGSDFGKFLDGARLNFSTADTNAYLYRSAANVLTTLGSLEAGTGTGRYPVILGTGTDAVKLEQDGSTLNFSAADTSAKLYRSATDTVSSLGNLASDVVKLTSPSTQLGVTVNRNGHLRHGTFKATIDYTAWTAAAATQDITLAVLPAGCRVLSVIMEQVTESGSGHMHLSVGITLKPEEFLLNQDTRTTGATWGLADLDLGINFNRANRIQNGLLESWTGNTNLIIQATNGGFAGGNLGNGSVTNFLQGSTTVYVTYEMLK